MGQATAFFDVRMRRADIWLIARRGNRNIVREMIELLKEASTSSSLRGHR